MTPEVKKQLEEMAKDWVADDRQFSCDPEIAYLTGATAAYELAQEEINELSFRGPSVKYDGQY